MLPYYAACVMHEQTFGKYSKDQNQKAIQFFGW